MSRHQSTENFQMDLRSSPSQHNLDASGSSSLQRDELKASARDKKKIDYYAIPVFVIEAAILVGLFALYFLVKSRLSEVSTSIGFFCDDLTIRRPVVSEMQIEQLMAGAFPYAIALIPLAVIVFCELINSMFGSMKFRKIRSICGCCQLHSITRRSMRFLSGYLLGLALSMIICEVLATYVGRLSPHFAHYCPDAYKSCPSSNLLRSQTISSTSTSATAQPQSAPISDSKQDKSPILINHHSASTDSLVSGRESQWVDLWQVNLTDLCQLTPRTEINIFRTNIYRSFPAGPTVVIAYSALFLACYLSFVGTARPFRMISMVLSAAIVVFASSSSLIMVNVGIYHWQDVVAGWILSLIIVIFIVVVYLNFFRDTHYYEKQMAPKKRWANSNYSASSISNNNMYDFQTYAADVARTNYDAILANGGPMQNSVGTSDNPVTAQNDIAMRYFQIPRANFRAQRPS